MTRVLCALDASPAALTAAESAIAYCVEHGAELELLSVVKGRGRRAAKAEARLEEARALAEAAGLAPTVETRFGDLLREMQRRARESGAHILVFARTRRKWWATLTGQPRAEIKQVTIRQPHRRQVRLVLPKTAAAGVRHVDRKPLAVRVASNARRAAAAESARDRPHSKSERGVR
jgi:nucleotide-binding universal stress UspA family protein